MNVKQFRFLYKYAQGVAIAIAMVGCSPRVTSEMTVEELLPQPTNKVMIIGAADSVPSDARAIGKLMVDGRSVSLKSQYARALSLAVTETARNGGNVLVVDNNEMNENHLKGTIAFMDGEVNESLTLSAGRIQQLLKMATVRTTTTVEQMDATKQQRIVQGQEMMRQQEQDKLQKSIMRQDSLAYAGALDFDWNEEHDTQGTLLKVSAGPVWTTSKIYYADDKYVTGQRGYAFSVSMAKTGNKPYGFGADFYGSYTNVDVPGSNSDDSYTLMYMGPCGLIGGNLTDWLRLDASFGLGLSYYQDDGQTEFGLGIRSSLGLEFLITKNTGIGVDLVRQLALFKRPDGFNQPEGEAYGFNHLGVMVTARYHF